MIDVIKLVIVCAVIKQLDIIITMHHLLYIADNRYWSSCVNLTLVMYMSRMGKEFLMRSLHEENRNMLTEIITDDYTLCL